MGLITLTKAKQYLNINLTDTAKNDIVTSLISESSNWIENYCNQNISSGINIFYEKGNGSTTFILRRYPSIELVAVSYRDKPSEAWTALNDCYLLDDDSLAKVYREDGFDENYYKFELRSGYTVVPDEVQAVCQEMVTIRFKEQNNDLLGVNSDSKNFSTYSENRNYKDMIPGWKSRLNPYRIPTV